jgi:hypothetical protein
MSRTCSSATNIQLAGYPAQRVFLARVGWAGENFAAGRTASPGRSVSIFAGRAAAGDQAGGLQGSPASITQIQALSAARIAAVAPLPSHRAAGSAQMRGFGRCRRMIANLQTRPSWALIGRAGGPRSSASGRGGATPSADPRGSYIPSRTPCRDLRKSAPRPIPAPDRVSAAVPPGPGSQAGREREVPNCRLGSGVRVCPTRAKSARKSAEFCGARAMARGGGAEGDGVAGCHVSLDLRGGTQQATGRG